MVCYVVDGVMKGAEEGETFIVNLPQNNQALMERLTDLQKAYPEVTLGASTRNERLGSVLYWYYPVHYYHYFILLPIESISRWRK